MPSHRNGTHPPQPVPTSQEHAETLAKVAQTGDRDAFGQLAEIFQQRIFGLTLMVLRDPKGAEEITQNTMIRAFTHIHQYDNQRPFYPWLATIAIRLAQNWLRDQAQKNKRESSASPVQWEMAPTINPLESLIAQERARNLWSSVANLPPGERTVTFLYYREDMKVKDISRILGITSGTVKTLLFRARRKLRQAPIAIEQTSSPAKELP